MDKIIIKGSCFLIPSEYEKAASFISKNARVTDDDIARICTDDMTKKHELISQGAVVTSEKLMEQLGAAFRYPSDETGISFGTTDGCWSSLSTAADGIAEKGVKGMRPKDATKCIMSGATAKVAMRFGFKAFSMTNCCGSNAGLEALIFAYDMLKSGRAKYALAGAGDEGSIYGALMLERADSSDLLSLAGRSRGLVYGSDIQEQLEYLIYSALRNSGVESADSVIVVGGAMSEALSQAAGKVFGSERVRLLNMPDTVLAASGIMAVTYADQICKENCVILQCSENGYFSALVLKK
ncbi:MAG: hypothetical protein IKP25_03660 [Ruminococcus sp.]|nr:hypothetical protein [Ruminococcus sp.]